MSETELSKIYEPQAVEAHWYEVWEKAGYFSPSAKATGGKHAPYVIVIPPPNVTGSLHMGHALNDTLQDILIRYHKMKGEAALWVPGTDHGGIATQNVVEKILQKEGTSRHLLGREKFLERMWSWRAETGDTILNQLRKIGATLDWTRTRFTMDEVCSKAVRKAFVELYLRKLLYRGKRLVNWCPRCNTALADIEVEHKDVKGHLWHIKYPLIDRRKKTPRATKKKAAAPSFYDVGYITVATTRPETMLGDTAVAVNPKDKRYKDVLGAKIRLPLTNREIPIVTDAVVDKNFGSGAVKVTPSHDQTDFEIAERARLPDGQAKLPHIAVIGFNGKMTEEAGASYAGLDRFEARKKIIEDLEKEGLLEKVEDYALSVSVCYRCDSVIEPLESEQWFLSMKQMAKRAVDATKKGKMRITPESWEHPYLLWLKNLKDWCISRQIWWGHRIPVWTCENHACPPIVALEDPTSCPVCKGKKLTQDPDVLDTWFSSALWPMSVFGWPDQTPDFKTYFPTSTLVTGHEILYLWVARMVMFALEFTGKVPYSQVLIHGIVRDKQGRKMSKSLGNVIDPLELIRDYGADAMRFSLAQSAAPGRDMQISKDNFVASRNFSNKIWNATRFTRMNLKDMKVIPELEGVRKELELADQWILHRYNEVVRETTAYMDNMEMDAASRGLYNFFWSDFCDWYLEMVKPRMASQAAQTVLATVLEGTLRLLHPFIPFITEELWQKIPRFASSKAHVMISSWPEPLVGFDNADAAKKMNVLREMVTKLRAIRSEMDVPITQPIEVIVRSTNERMINIIESQKKILESLNTRVAALRFDPNAVRPEASAAAVIPGVDIFVPLSGVIDFEKAVLRLEKELSVVGQDHERLSKKLSNQDFIAHAPPEEITKAKLRFAETAERIKQLQGHIDDFKKVSGKR